MKEGLPYDFVKWKDFGSNGKISFEMERFDINGEKSIQNLTWKEICCP